MIIVNPYLGKQGRLGNQLFQVASTIGLGYALESPVVLPADWVYRPFFSVPDHYFGEASPGNGRTDVTELKQVTHIPESMRGFLQDYSLFRDIEGEIKMMLKPSEVARDQFAKPEYDNFFDLVKAGFVLSVHVRRGDNVPGQDPGVPDKERYHPLRPMSYYEDGIKMFPDSAQLAVFSDEPEWCADYFGDRAAYVHYGVTRPKEHEPGYDTAPVLDWIDLMLMSFCDYHVISNSTYAWWGAFLSIDQAPVYPLPFFGPALDFIDTKLLFPGFWQAIDHG